MLWEVWQPDSNTDLSWYHLLLISGLSGDVSVFGNIKRLSCLYESCPTLPSICCTWVFPTRGSSDWFQIYQKYWNIHILGDSCLETNALNKLVLAECSSLEFLCILLSVVENKFCSNVMHVFGARGYRRQI